MVLEEVIVTAQKRQESLQSIPLSISAFNGDEIRDMGAIDFRGLSTRLANVNVSNDQDSIDIAIRGISNNRGFAPATAFHIDGIYTGQSQSGLTAFLDVQRVEVLRGPQGTLYGRNATAGAINVITNRPDTEELSGSIEMTAGNYDLLNVQAVGNVPIIKDQLALRIALLSEDRDGYTEHDGMGFSQDPSDDCELTGGKIRLLYPIFDEETVIAYELGSKNRLMGGRLQLNAAIFYYDYSDLQVSGIEVIPQLDENGEPIPDPDNPDAFLIESVNTSNSNIDSSEMYDGEVEWVALLSESFQFDGALGLLRTEIDKGVVDNGAVFGASPTIVSGNEMRKAPGMSLNLGLQYDADVPAIAGSITARLDFHYEEEQYHDVINRPEDLTDSFTKTDISVTYRTENARYFVQLFGRNLEDEDVRTTVFQSAAGPLVAFAPPRTYGVRAGVEF